MRRPVKSSSYYGFTVKTSVIHVHSARGSRSQDPSSQFNGLKTRAAAAVVIPVCLRSRPLVAFAFL